MKISLIAAMGTNRVIGRGYKMPWHLPDDLSYFMETTRDHFILMGRKTFQAYKKIMRNHKVIVVTSQTNYDSGYADVVRSINEGIEKAKQSGETELFVAGGGQIFSKTIGIANRIYLTIIYHDFKGDVFFPDFEEQEWQLVSKIRHNRDEKHEHEFDFMVFERKSF